MIGEHKEWFVFFGTCHWSPKREGNPVGVCSCKQYTLVIEKIHKIVGRESNWLTPVDQANKSIPEEEGLARMGSLHTAP